ncbi:MAG TPA: sodium:solute symporter [Candidatus Dormibacteraeota bacterium]|nr:sodium:solute symporter [Candidatus Dormibacteraeota bacterium]
MIHGDQLAVFAILFMGVSLAGFWANRWRRADLRTLDQWGLAGRSLGTVINWFLMGGDLYTAYTFIAVPALVFGKGAIGLFAIPYTIIVYPLVYVVMPRLWRVGRHRGHVTPSDYVGDRFDSRLLSVLIAITGIVATIPYIALQMFGIQVVLAQMGVPVELALVIAFLILAFFTYLSGLRAPAMIAFAKDVLIWSTILVAVIYLPIRLGGYGAIFAHVPTKLAILPRASYVPYSTLAFGSALALFLYPHAVTSVLASKDQDVIKRNAAFLPAYSFLLGLIAILGYVAIAAGIHPSKAYGPNSAVPQLFAAMFPGPFTGYAFAAIAIGALVPASVMSIAAANLFSRNLYRELFRPTASANEETNVSKVFSGVVKLGALLFILLVPTTYVINFQLAGGVWILQTLPAVFLSLYLRWLDRWAVAAGWAVGIGLGTYWLVQVHFAASTISLFGLTHDQVYIALAAFIANLIVVIGGSLIARLLGAAGRTRLAEADYEVSVPSGA